MIKNVGKPDKIARIIIGLIIIVLGFVYESYWGLVGLVPLLTAGMNFCPLYAPFRINTNKKMEK